MGRLEFRGPCHSALLCPVLWCMELAAPPACANHGVSWEPTSPRRAEAGESQHESFLLSPTGSLMGQQGRGALGLGARLGRADLLTALSCLHRPFPSEETAENDDDVYRSLEELAE